MNYYPPESDFDFRPDSHTLPVQRDIAADRTATLRMADKITPIDSLSMAVGATVGDITGDITSDSVPTHAQPSTTMYARDGWRHVLTFINDSEESLFVYERFLNDENFTASINGQLITMRVFRMDTTWLGGVQRRYELEEHHAQANQKLKTMLLTKTSKGLRVELK